MNSNNRAFTSKNNFNSKLSNDSGHFTSQSFSSGRCTPNAHVSYGNDMSNAFNNSLSAETFPFFCDKTFDFGGRKLYQQCVLNTGRSDSSKQEDFNRRFNKVVSCIDGPFSKNNSRFLNQQYGSGDRNGHNRGRRSFKQESQLSSVFHNDVKDYEYVE